jgi:glucose/arabinose dehydrogenase
MRLVLLVIAWSLVSACENAAAPPLPDSIQVVPAVTGLVNPVFLTAPAGDSRLFIAEQRGTIRVVKNGVLLAAPYLDLRGRLTSGGESGLLGLAFHPNFALNGFFYVQYTDLNGDSEIERYHATPSSDVADANSASHVLGFDQPFANHNGGMLLAGCCSSVRTGCCGSAPGMEEAPAIPREMASDSRPCWERCCAST